MNSLSNHKWYFFGHGDWLGPFAFGKIKKLTSDIRNPFLMAGGVTDEQLNELTTYPKIGGLAIVSPEITVSATAPLLALPKLRELILCGRPITDDFVIRLVNLTTLQAVTRVDTACTEDGVHKFLDSLPGCDVYRGNEHSIYPAFDRLELPTWLRLEMADPE